jgi:hypothetical protein
MEQPARQNKRLKSMSACKKENARPDKANKNVKNQKSKTQLKK